MIWLGMMKMLEPLGDELRLDLLREQDGREVLAHLLDLAPRAGGCWSTTGTARRPPRGSWGSWPRLNACEIAETARRGDQQRTALAVHERRADDLLPDVRGA